MINMKRWLAVLILSLGTRTFAQVAALPIQQCLNNATQASLSGMQSTNYLVGDIPSCTVTIYLTGTTTLATYYFTPLGTPQTGPFTASSTGQWLAFVSPSQGYDVVLSGGVSPNTYTAPLTFTDISPGGGGGSGTGTVTSFSAPSGSWPTWLVPVVTNPATTPSLAVTASAIPTALLPTYTKNSIIFAGVGGVPTEDNTNFTWNDSTQSMLIGGPSTSLESSLAVTGANSSGAVAGLYLNNAGTSQWHMYADSSNNFHLTSIQGGNVDVISTGGAHPNDLNLNAMQYFHGGSGYIDVNYGNGNTQGMNFYGTDGATLEASILTYGPAGEVGGVLTGGIANYSFTASQKYGVFNIGGTTVCPSDTGYFSCFYGSANGYLQSVFLNANSGSAASSDVVVGNNNYTATTYYGDFGMNSSGWAGASGTFNAPNAVYLYAQNSEMDIGTVGAQPVSFLYNSLDYIQLTSGGVYLPQIAPSTTSSCMQLTTAGLVSIVPNQACGTVDGTLTTVGYFPQIVSPNTLGKGTYTLDYNAINTGAFTFHNAPLIIDYNPGSGYQLNVSGFGYFGRNLQVVGTVNGQQGFYGTWEELNPTAATSSVNQYPPGGLTWAGNIWHSGASVANTVTAVISGPNGADPLTSLTFANTTTGTGGFQTVIAGGLQVQSVRATAGNYCLQADTSGNITNTGSACGSGGTGTVTDGSGVTTANIIPVSTTTAHVLGYTPNSTFNLLAPTITANDTVATLGLAQTFTGANSFTSSILPTTAGTPSLGSTTKWWNSVYLGTGTSFYVQLTPATPTASYTLTIPALTANDTIATLAGAQTFTGTKTFPSPTFTGTVTAAAISPSGLILSSANNGAIRLSGTVNAASSYQVQIQASPYAAGTSTTNFPVVAFNPSGAAVTTWNATASGGTFMGFAPATGFAGNLIDGHAPNGGASIFSVNYQGFVNATGYGNVSSLTVAAGAAAGTSPTIACATNTTCGWNGGTVNLLTGTSTTATGVLLTVTDTITHSKYPSCTYEIFPASSSYVPNGAVITNFFPTNTSYTVETLNNVTAALSASSYYVINYHCSGA